MTTRLELADLQFDFGVPTFLVGELTKRHALPSWWRTLTEDRHGDWVTNFHQAFTQELPRHLREVAAGSIQTSLSPQVHVLAEASTIAFPIGTAVLLHELLEIVFGNLIHPASLEPYAQMMISGEGKNRSVRRLQTMIGRLRATNSPDCSSEVAKWHPGGVAASHFMYCHELIHVWMGHRPTSTISFCDEYVADLHACLLMSQTYRSRTLFQQGYTLLGPFVALALEAVKEAAFPGDEWDRTHPRPHDRVAFLRAIVEAGEHGDLFPQGSVAAGDAFWSMFSDFLLQATALPEEIPDPVGDLLFCAVQPGTMCDASVVNPVLQWCAFGSVTTVGRSLVRASRMNVPGRITDHPVIQRLLAETKHLESKLGLARQLSLPLSSDPPPTQYRVIATRLISEQLQSLPETRDDNDLMRMWMRLLFQAITEPVGTGDTVANLLAEQIAADPAFATSVDQCIDLVQGLTEPHEQEKLCRDAASCRVPRIAVLTNWLVESFELGWLPKAMERDTYRPMRIAKLTVMFGFLIRRDVPEAVSLLLEEWTRKG